MTKLCFVKFVCLVVFILAMYNIIIFDSLVSKYCFPSSLHVFLSSFWETSRLEPSLERTERCLEVGHKIFEVLYQRFSRGLSNCSMKDSKVF